ncbi:MAG TPA: succinate dehydrogenase/fumarate reductase iron-sulfur subunit [Bacteroidales bacterium]|jgi:succinate dehydrogenase / fumarate reductase iron-sulfur subunit|nr:succinate dehydrogenase/fumarate reductase iron-sulfur subunit [Bacteroidales bacterium]NLK55199.1 succinate dehydrogenase/fumarate reductase iron-sulfur subunit [Bacteroidales bacterium]HNY52225.1 succinate dehydrogenase/fumarate reductase iron-sulfur subunit [Bacteroidales bacterium]HOG57018.1 succinate dehydrogenase/fumarate reductase iron-sulfur subunit [Bacteroidales bacterium]HPV16429.1 succinate dehydrogenase/fumarate reductase iron-sulfur subunit [Bacteroidales bacterium]
MNLTLKIWRQKDAKSKGKFVTYKMADVSPEMSFLEMLDALNKKLVESGGDPVAFEHDCREGICGTCGMYINGHPHGPVPAVTTCMLSMRYFSDGDTITVEPWRAKPFPVIRDLIVDRSAMDKIQVAGGYISVNTGAAPDANSILVPKKNAEEAFDAAACIGCGACVAACKNASAMLFVSARISQYALLPQGRLEAKERVRAMVEKMDELGFGNCSNTGACEAECPKQVKLVNIARLNREYYKAY